MSKAGSVSNNSGQDPGVYRKKLEDARTEKSKLEGEQNKDNGNTTQNVTGGGQTTEVKQDSPKTDNSSAIAQQDALIAQYEQKVTELEQIRAQSAKAEAKDATEKTEAA